MSISKLEEKLQYIKHEYFKEALINVCDTIEFIKLYVGESFNGKEKELYAITRLTELVISENSRLVEADKLVKEEGKAKEVCND